MAQENNKIQIFGENTQAIVNADTVLNSPILGLRYSSQTWKTATFANSTIRMSGFTPGSAFSSVALNTALFESSIGARLVASILCMDTYVGLPGTVTTDNISDNYITSCVNSIVTYLGKIQGLRDGTEIAHTAKYCTTDGGISQKANQIIDTNTSIQSILESINLGTTTEYQPGKTNYAAEIAAIGGYATVYTSVAYETYQGQTVSEPIMNYYVRAFNTMQQKTYTLPNSDIFYLYQRDLNVGGTISNRGRCVYGTLVFSNNTSTNLTINANTKLGLFEYYCPDYRFTLYGNYTTGPNSQRGATFYVNDSELYIGEQITLGVGRMISISFSYIKTYPVDDTFNWNNSTLFRRIRIE